MVAGERFGWVFWGEAMRGMHKGIFRAYATEAHDVQAMIKAVCNVSYRLPLSRGAAAALWHSG